MSLERRYEITRLEAFSDAVFAFALTLLVVSLEVPHTYAELIHLIRGFLPFACCFALLVWIWYEHSAFFSTYPLHDALTAARGAWADCKARGFELTYWQADERGRWQRRQ